MLGQVLRDARLRSGLKVAELAALAGIRTESLSRIEAGKQQVAASTLVALSDLIKLPASEWIDPWLEQEARLGSLVQVARHLINGGDLPNALLVLKRARALACFSPHHFRGEVYHQWGRYTYKAGQHARALHWLKLAERASLRSLHPYDKALASYNYALALRKTHFLAGSLAKFNDAIAVFDDGGHLRQAAYARLSRANLLLETGSYREALAGYLRAARSLRGDPWLFDCKLGEVLCIGHLRSAQVALVLMSKLENLASDPVRQAKFHHNVGVLCRQLGMLDCALTHLSLALESRNTDVSSIAATLAEVCLCRTMIGDTDGAQLALSRFRDLEGPKDPQDAWTMAALSSVLQGTALPEPLPNILRDDHERRLRAAFSLLLASAHSLAWQRGTGTLIGST
ncbi:MAG: helix-turn-helix domain-containing protein [Thermaerobacter sp.]|nr:helix-turn-helix domain-containing protein [Thermaerobacter sp.]